MENCSYFEKGWKFAFTFDYVGHKSIFNDEPDAAWNVKKAGLNGQEYRHPLVVRVIEVSSFIIFSCTWKVKSVGDIKTAVHPAITV